MEPYTNRVTKLFNITIPIIPAGMECSGWKLASAVSQFGGLGLIGGVSMYPEMLRHHIKKCKALTTRAFGVNVYFMRRFKRIINVITQEGVKIVFTSAGSPSKRTLKQLTPVRMVKNKFFHEVQEAELRGATKEELNQLVGERRSKLGIFEGDLDEGELKIGQVSSGIKKIQPAAEILKEMWDEYNAIKKLMYL